LQSAGGEGSDTKEGGGMAGRRDDTLAIAVGDEGGVERDGVERDGVERDGVERDGEDDTQGGHDE